MIKTLGTRYPELGRLRLGDKGPKGEPRKGEFLRFSSNDEVVLKALASQLGGTVVPWPNGEQTHHLTTESATVDVFLPPDPVDTAYELWGSGGCSRRCDGERCTFLNTGPQGPFMDTADCLCLEEGKVPGDRQDREACNVTVRLRLVIPDVPGVGVWICTSHSIYAAMELPGQINVLESAMGGSGGLIPATFAIEHRSEKKPYEKYPRKYIVPVLRVRASLAALAAAHANGNGVVNGANPGALAAAPAALEAGSDTPAAGSGDPQPTAPEATATTRSGATPPASRTSKPATPPSAPAGSSPAGAADNPRPFLRVNRTRARRLWPDDTAEAIELRLDTITEEVTDGRLTRFADVTEPGDANAVLAELGRIAEGAGAAS